jgi:dienelactone hydrolase
VPEAGTLGGVRLVLAVAGAAILASPAAGGGFPRFGAGCARDDFASGGATVRAELCRARGGGGAAVVVLHGCGGFSTFDHRIVKALPGYGISTLDVDYSNAFGKVGDAFSTWVTVARDAATALRSTSGIRRVGVVGWSLGGGVALQAAAAPPASRPFAAVAGFSTGSFRASALASELPPTILLSGGRTDVIPLTETLPLYRALRAAHVPSELYVYPRGSHNWPGRQGALGIQRAATFLRRYLG